MDRRGVEEGGGHLVSVYFVEQKYIDFFSFYIIKWNFLYVCMYPDISRNTACTALKQTPKIR